ncbi:MAG: class I SAM-dependent methyltransferase [Bacilli bacterium]|nr:class I SAM-dependent methyltransferase [Bacilli bacterium]
MIKLSKRLLVIASYISNHAKMVDIGCDHALLDIYLVNRYPKLKAIAVDVRPGAIDQARRNLEKFKMTGAIDLRLGDGLEVVEKDEIDTIVMSGLGCSKIVEILTKDKSKLSNVNDLIIQSNTDYYDLRKTISSFGYFIVDEQLVKENKIIYLIIHFRKGNKKYSKRDYLYGPVLRREKSNLYREMINNDIRQKEILYSLIPQKYLFKRLRLKACILSLKREIR